MLVGEIGAKMLRSLSGLLYGCHIGWSFAFGTSKVWLVLGFDLGHYYVWVGDLWFVSLEWWVVMWCDDVLW
jgi:hypothetical protein